jgi:hypothetical protein
MKKRWWILIAIVVIVPILWLIFYHLYYRAQFDRRVEALTAEGFPVSLEDLEKDYILPEGVLNAADIYIEAFSHFQQSTEQEQKYLPISGAYRWPDDAPPFPKEVMNALETYLQRNQRTLELLDEAGEVKYCLWSRKRDDLGFHIENLSAVKKMSMLLCERNLDLAQKGQTKELLTSFQSLTALSDSLLQQPVLIDYLVSMALKGLAAGNLETVLKQVELTEPQLKQLQMQFAALNNPDELYRTLVNERCSMIVGYHLPLKKQYDYLNAFQVIDFCPPLTKAAYLLSGINRKDKCLSLGFYERILDASQSGPHQRLSLIQPIDVELNSYSEDHLYLREMSVFVKIFKIDIRVLGGLRCAETALAIERYRLKYETLPELLEELVPEFMEAVPLDPFDGRPLRYVLQEEGGYTVYTIGEEGVDNGGLSREQMEEKTGEKNPAEYDWPFTVRR